MPEGDHVQTSALCTSHMGSQSHPAPSILLHLHLLLRPSIHPPRFEILSHHYEFISNRLSGIEENPGQL